MARIFILRIGHRVFRDSRVTTHVCLTARALGAEGVIIADQEDKVVESTIRDVTNRFGGPFEVQSAEIQDADADLLVIVGSEKMPGEIFRIADWNISVTNQPMSEVAALAIFLDWFRQHSEFDREFSKAQVQIVPSKSGKEIQQLPR